MSPIPVCYLCGGKELQKRAGGVRDNPTLDVMECSGCGLVFLSSFAHVEEGFYEAGRMHDNEIDADLDAWIKETARDDDRRFRWLRALIPGKSILDFGCGAGMFLKRTIGIAKSVSGIEPEKRLKAHFDKQGLRVAHSLVELKERFDIITMFHVLEHLRDPVQVLKELSACLNENGEIIVEVPNANDALLTLYHSKPFSEFTYWSRHLFLYEESTLARLAEKAGLKVNYIKQVQRYTLANHLYWLAEGKPGGHKEWDFLDTVELNAAYEERLAAAGCCDTIVASFSVM